MSIKFNPENRTLTSMLSTRHIYDFFSSKGFSFSNEVLGRYYLSLKTKPFVILSGISGTGKTKIAQLFAEYICQNENPEKSSQRIAFVPVRPDWMDNRGLLGYYNILDETYHATKMLNILIDAGEHPEVPYFVILDEMNLAKVEHYFSDFLSIMESRTPDNPKGEKITLHAMEEALAENGRMIPGSIHLPNNVFFAGTVNVDESTYMFSHKVLDRANVIEFNEVDLSAYSGGAPEQRRGMTLINGEVMDQFFDSKKSLLCQKSDYEALDSRAKDYIEGIHTILKEDNLHFGYRTVNELSRFIKIAMEEAGESCLDDAVDIQIIQKILPKLHGTRVKLEEPLKKLFDFCHHNSGHFSNELADKAALLSQDFRFPRSGRKIARMLDKLNTEGYASFVE